MRKRRLADWFEKMSAAFMVGSFLTDKSFALAVGFGVACLCVAMYLTDQGGRT
jgi:hypothetical protein